MYFFQYNTTFQFITFFADYKVFKKIFSLFGSKVLSPYIG